MLKAWLIADLLAVLVIVVTAFICKKKGFIKTFSGILALFAAFSISGFLSNISAQYISEKYIAPRINSAITHEFQSVSEIDLEADSTKLKLAFKELGISEAIVDEVISELSDTISDGNNALTLIADSISYKIAHLVLFIVYFIISLLLISILLKFLNLAAKMPGLNFANKVLGLILGLIFGYLIVMILSFVLLKFGIYLNTSIINNTILLKNIMHFSLTAFF